MRCIGENNPDLNLVSCWGMQERDQKGCCFTQMISKNDKGIEFETALQVPAGEPFVADRFSFDWRQSVNF